MQYVNHPEEAAAASGMYAGGDLILEIFIGCMLLVPTFFLVLVIRNSEALYNGYSLTLLGLSLLLGLGCLLSCLFLRLVVLFPLFTSAGHRAHSGADSCSFSRIAGHRADSGASGGTSGSTLHGPAFADSLPGLLRRLLLGGLLLLGARPCRWRSLGVDATVLHRRTIAIALVLELLVSHGRVRCAEIDGLVLDSFDAAAGADRLIIDLNLRQLRVFVEPLLVQRRRKRGASPVYLDVLGGNAGPENDDDYRANERDE